MTTPSGAEIIPNRWVRFTRAWDWDIPEYGGRATKHFPAGCEIRLTCRQYEPALAAGVAVSIPNPRHARTAEADYGRPSHLDDHA